MPEGPIGRMRLTQEETLAILESEYGPDLKRSQLDRSDLTKSLRLAGNTSLRRFPNAVMLSSERTEGIDRQFVLVVRAISPRAAKPKARFAISSISPIRTHKGVEAEKILDQTGRDLYAVVIEEGRR